MGEGNEGLKELLEMTLYYCCVSLLFWGHTSGKQKSETETSVALGVPCSGAKGDS